MRKYAARLKQFLRCAALDNLSVAQNDNLIRLHQRRHAVRNQDERRAAAASRRRPRMASSVLASTADSASSKTMMGACSSSVLAIAVRCFCPPGEGHAALADNRIIAVLKAGNRIMQTGFLRRLLDFRLTDAVFGDGDILRDRS